MKNENKKFKCPYCNKEYKTSWRFRSHLILKHDRNHIVIFALLAILGLVLTLGALLYSDQIKYSWDKHIFHKEPYVTISLNQIMLMENPYGFIDISNETGLRLHFDCIFYETCMIHNLPIWQSVPFVRQRNFRLFQCQDRQAELVQGPAKLRRTTRRLGIRRISPDL